MELFHHFSLLNWSLIISSWRILNFMLYIILVIICELEKDVKCFLGILGKVNGGASCHFGRRRFWIGSFAFGNSQKGHLKSSFCLRSFEVKYWKYKMSNPFLGVSCVHGLSGFTSAWNLLFFVGFNRSKISANYLWRNQRTKLNGFWTLNMALNQTWLLLSVSTVQRLLPFVQPIFVLRLHLFSTTVKLSLVRSDSKWLSDC